MPKLRSNGRLQSRLHDILVKSSSRYAHPIVAVTKPIDDMIDRLIKNARGAAAVFMTEDRRAARQLLGEKEVFREIEARTTEEYFGRTRGRAETIEMSKLFLDIVRDLKRVNAHLAAAAYPVLEGRGELLPSRLKDE